MNRLQATIGDQPSDKNKTNGAVSSGHSVRPDDKQQEVSIEGFLSEVRHILVPVNLAQDSLKTIRCAIRLGQHCGARLTLLHVYQLPVAFGIPSVTYKNAEFLQDRHEAEETLKALGASVRAAYPNCEWVMRSGDAGKGILDVALELGVDLIVISSHYHHWYDRYRPTNIADYIVRHAACPILEVSDSGESFLNCLDNHGGERKSSDTIHRGLMLGTSHGRQNIKQACGRP
jgi:nucleotide-binding universal stress UspA family protein